MDIEGAEFRVLLDTSPALLERCRIIVVEFHSMEQVFCRYSRRQIKAVFDKLIYNHDVVHIHPNNYGGIVSRLGYEVPPLIEVTLLRRDRNAAPHLLIAGFPHALDADCLGKYPHVVLPECWWR